MDKKFFVPFETAKLLKEKGYPQGDSDMYYNPNGELFTRTELDAGYKEEYPIMIKYYVAAPTYHEVEDWLEGKGIEITSRKVYHFRTEQWEWRGNAKNEEYSFFELGVTREAAINAAILHALEEMI